jgi:hypothetical protein
MHNQAACQNDSVHTKENKHIASQQSAERIFPQSASTRPGRMLEVGAAPSAPVSKCCQTAQRAWHLRSTAAVFCTQNSSVMVSTRMPELIAGANRGSPG